MAEKKHAVVVFEHRGSEKYDPYIIAEGEFLANCECGWSGKPRDNAPAAFADARGHSESVEPEVLDFWRSERPLYVE
jgi:hypothetical protein